MRPRFDFHRTGWLKDTIPVFILLLFTCLFFSDTLFGNKIFIHRDLSRFFYPLREFSISQIKSAQIPLWNPYIHCGSAHIAELQTCVFYPLSIVYLLFSYPVAFNYFIILHVFFAGLFTFILMRAWNHSRYASFFSGLVFMFSGYIISVINLLASLASVIWLPLVILFYDRALSRDWIKNSVITGVFLTFMFLGGEPAILYATLFILFLMSFGRGKRTIKGLAPLALALLLTAALACFQILPFMEFIRHSSRGIMDFGEASMWSLPPYALLDLLVPYISETDYLYKNYWTRQSWLLIYYMGLSGLICAFISLKFDITKKRRYIFYILALGLVLSFGLYTPLYYFLYRIMPGFRLSRYPIKFFFMAAFSLAVLAGMGLDYYRENIRSSQPLRRFLRSLLAFGVVASFFYLIINLHFAEAYDFINKKMLEFFPVFMDKKGDLAQLVYVGICNLRRTAGFFMIITLFMFLGASRKMKLNLLIPLLMLVSFLDIFTANKNVYPNMDIEEYLKPGDSVEFLKKDNTLFRIFNSPATLSQNMFVPEKDYFEGMSALKERIAANMGVGFGIYDAYGYGSLYNRRHEEIICIITKSDLPDETNLLNLLNVKYVISPKDFKAKGYNLVRKNKKVNIYENKNVLPRVFLVNNAVIIKDEYEILETLKRRGFDPSKEVILEEELSFSGAVPEGMTTRSRKGEDKAIILEYSPNKVIIKTKVDTSKFLVLSDSYYPGWKVYVDGREEKIYRADYVLRAVYLREGEHIVKFIYDPFSFKIGLIITLLTIIMLIWLVKGKTEV